MSSSIRFIGVDSVEVSRNITSTSKLGDVLGSNQKGLINGQTHPNNTTLRAGDVVEVFAKSAKAGI